MGRSFCPFMDSSFLKYCSADKGRCQGEGSPNTPSVCSLRSRPAPPRGRLYAMPQYLADLNEQAQERLDTIMEQMKATEGVTEELKRTQQMEWVQRCNNIHNRAEEIVLHDIIYSYGSN